MTSRRFSGDAQRTRFENTERPSQSSQAGVRDIRQMQAMMQENSRLERRQDLERRIGKSIEPQYVTSDVLRPIKLTCEKEYFTGFDNKKVLDACEKVALFNKELSNETQNIYRSRHGDISKDNAIDAIAFIFKETDKSTDLNIRRSARQQILNSLAEVPRQQPEAQARPSDAQVYATSQRGPSFHKATQQADLSPQDDQSGEFHEPSSTNTGKGKEKVLHREHKEIADPEQKQQKSQRRKVKKRIKKAKSTWEKHPTENATKLQELKNARNNTDDELSVVDKYVKKIPSQRKHKKIADPEQKQQRDKDIKRITATRSNWERYPEQNATKLQELKDADGTDEELAVINKYVKKYSIKDEEIEDLE